MATKKRLSLLCEIENFANIYLEKVTKFQGNGLLRFGVLSHLLGWRWKTPPGAYRVKPGFHKANYDYDNGRFQAINVKDDRSII